MATDAARRNWNRNRLKMLFGLPLLAGILLTIADVLVVLLFLRFGIRRVEVIVLVAILTVSIIFVIQLGQAPVQLCYISSTPLIIQKSYFPSPPVSESWAQPSCHITYTYTHRLHKGGVMIIIIQPKSQKHCASPIGTQQCT